MTRRPRASAPGRGEKRRGLLWRQQKAAARVKSNALAIPVLLLLLTPQRDWALTDPVQIVVAAAALLAGFLLGYAVRSYVSRRRRRRLRYVGAGPLVLPEDRQTTTDIQPHAVDIHHRPGLVKALVTILVYAAVVGWMWLHYPACEQGHVAVFAPQSASMWACAQGRLSSLGSTASTLVPAPSTKQ
jgi:hypothetical protein